MNDILLPPTRHTPAIDFRFSEHRLSMKGELYPENAALFFTPLMASLKTYLDRADPVPLTVSLDLLYMNSASTKKVFQIAGLLDIAARAGRAVALDFESDPDNEIMVEFAADLAEDFPTLAVRVVNPA